MNLIKDIESLNELIQKYFYLFSGDSYIPNVQVVTKLKGGDRDANKKSLQKIKGSISENTIICPGHGEMTKSIK
jgi:hydroxyacylglutathione hydrolase